jgi:integrase
LSTEKKPLIEKEFDKILQVATRTSEEARKVVLFLRFTGMHVSVLAEPDKYNLRIEDDEIKWDRPKKTGKIAFTSIPISKNLDFDIEEYIQDLRMRKRKKSRQYFYDLVKTLGEKAGLSNVSPMSFRHTIGVDMLNRGFDRYDVKQTLNCSDRVLSTYLKHSSRTRKEKFKRLGW